MQRSGRRLEVTVLGHRYPVRSPGSAKDETRLHQAAQMLNERIAEIQGATGEVNGQHLAVMAALSLADEVLAETERRGRERADDDAFRRAVRERSEKLLALVHEELEARLQAAVDPPQPVSLPGP